MILIILTGLKQWIRRTSKCTISLRISQAMRSTYSMYMTSQVNDHQATLGIFETEINSGTNQKVKAYAQKYRPHIEHHLEEADSIRTVVMTNQDGN